MRKKYINASKKFLLNMHLQEHERLDLRNGKEKVSPCYGLNACAPQNVYVEI